MKIYKKLPRKTIVEMTDWIALNINPLAKISIEFEDNGLNAEANEIDYKISSLYRNSKWSYGQWICYFNMKMKY